MKKVSKDDDKDQTEETCGERVINIVKKGQGRKG